MKEWHQILKTVRAERGFTLREVEEKANVSNAYVSQLENGQIKEPSFFKMHRILSLYGISATDLGISME